MSWTGVHEQQIDQPSQAFDGVCTSDGRSILHQEDEVHLPTSTINPSLLDMRSAGLAGKSQQRYDTMNHSKKRSLKRLRISDQDERTRSTGVTEFQYVGGLQRTPTKAPTTAVRSLYTAIESEDWQSRLKSMATSCAGSNQMNMRPVSMALDAVVKTLHGLETVQEYIALMRRLVLLRLAHHYLTFYNLLKDDHCERRAHRERTGGKLEVRVLDSMIVAAFPKVGTPPNVAGQPLDDWRARTQKERKSISNQLRVAKHWKAAVDSLGMGGIALFPAKGEVNSAFDDEVKKCKPILASICVPLVPPFPPLSFLSECLFDIGQAFKATMKRIMTLSNLISTLCNMCAKVEGENGDLTRCQPHMFKRLQDADHQELNQYAGSGVFNSCGQHLTLYQWGTIGRVPGRFLAGTSFNIA
ncbi:uncharacterized protein HMPREF1541_03677 [Cyphellophora europaea CBS 101466]|uniref:Uncharacterized protein n=1 Tax=Cyphellophora europaea (strain CBS 101466) TaxID=1220924 RepID=W2RZH3_CYPE1|nr:uncharacterized protein HMPREF1541_03677 [Cyphellophora europaea CBS 101466]ETN41740.1 hypothetical protein HMPREF1541_03677 [Cyphellophora europaea CBS 101466]